jgi:uncharacterized phage-associated protein
MNLETIVNYLKELYRLENNTEINLLTLHNLLFYVNLFSLRDFGKLLFDNEIVAHDHGPCVIGVKCPNEL